MTCLLPLGSVDADDNIVTGALVIFTSAFDDLIVSLVVEVDTTTAVADSAVEFKARACCIQHIKNKTNFRR